MASRKARSASNSQGARPAQLSSMLEKAPINVLYADRDLRIIYMNESSRRTLKTIERLLPVKVDDILGKSIDIFHKDPARVRAHLEAVRGVSAVHDLHIWPLSTTETALTCHLVMKDGSPGDTFLVEIARQLKERFSIAHATIQVETGEVVCALEPEHIV